MNERTVWERYVQSWKVASVAEKHELFATCLTRTCVYMDPSTVARGWDELAAYMVEFHRQVPGGHFVTEYFLAHHGRSIARWRMVAGDGTKIGEGISHAQYDDAGVLVAMTGFFESAPAGAEASAGVV